MGGDGDGDGDGGNNRREHVMMFPFMAKGHTIPLLQLAKELTLRGLRVSLITTPSNAPFLRRRLPLSLYPDVSLLTIPFPTSSSSPLPPGIESTDHLPSPDLYPAFLRATALLRSPLRRLLLLELAAGSSSSSASSPPPLCFVADFFLSWSLPLARDLGVPALVFHGMSAFSMSIVKSLFSLLTSPSPSPASSADALSADALSVISGGGGGGDAPFRVPGDPRGLLFSRPEIPDAVRTLDDPVTRFLLEEVGDAEYAASWGVLVNSFAEVDRDYVDLFEGFYRGAGGAGARAWLVGPMSLLAGEGHPADAAAAAAAEEEEEDPEGCLAWLDEKHRRAGEAAYVAFGTQVHVADEQLDEVAHGLVGSGYPFIWAVRSDTWAPPESLAPEIRSRGKIVPGWVPQKAVLAHAAVGGFVTHCGWNSVLESLSAGVPMLTWPMIAEQTLNAKHVAEVMGAGVRLRLSEKMQGEIITGAEVAEGLREVMGGGGDAGRRARARAAELREAASAAVAEGGASRTALETMLEELRMIQNYYGGGRV